MKPIRRNHPQELDAKRAQERESVAAWETHWRTQEKQLKIAVEDGRQRNQAMQAKLGALEARLQGAFEEIEKLRGAAGAASEKAGQLEKELEEERQAYRELEEEKVADRQVGAWVALCDSLFFQERGFVVDNVCDMARS